jgi:uncharacterized protein YodC (DUF2158 family)
MSEANKFKVGDVVELKSGGPKMTVADVNPRIGSNAIRCQWFGGKKLESGLFDPSTLVHAPEGGQK